MDSQKKSKAEHGPAAEWSGHRVTTWGCGGDFGRDPRYLVLSLPWLSLIGPVLRCGRI